MKILFIQKSGYYEAIGVMYISSYLKSHGHLCELLITDEEKDLDKSICEINPDLFAFSCTTDMHNWVVEMAGRLKKNFNKPIIIGGPHPTCFPEIIHNREIDMVCLGEGEQVMLELAERMDRKRGYADIPGLWMKEKGRLRSNELGELVEDLGEYPFPDRELYYKYSFLRDLPLKRFITGRGCPFKCAFCHNQLLKKIMAKKGKFVRQLPVKKVIGEILEVQNKYPMKNIHFSDDTFVLNRVWVTDFCRVYAKKVNLPFSCNVRADLIDVEVVEMLKSANCQAVSFGLESGNEDIRNRVLGKQINDDVVIKAVLVLKQNKIKCLTTNMVGVPGETEKDIWDTLKLNRELQTNFTRCFIFDAFPGLPLTEYAIKLGHLKPGYSLKDYSALSHEPIVMNVNHDLIKNFNSLFFFLVKVPVPVVVLKIILKFPYNRVVYLVGRIFQAYSEATFFRIPILPGLKYFAHVYGSFKSN